MTLIMTCSFSMTKIFGIKLILLHYLGVQFSSSPIFLHLKFCNFFMNWGLFLHFLGVKSNSTHVL